MLRDSFPTTEIEDIASPSNLGIVVIRHHGTVYRISFPDLSGSPEAWRGNLTAAYEFVRMVKEGDTILLNYTGQNYEGKIQVSWASVISHPRPAPPSPVTGCSGLEIWMTVFLGAILVCLLIQTIMKLPRNRETNSARTPPPLPPA